jgi:Dolichyl-phosphate-mannose-protein mannosyltransferase
MDSKPPTEAIHGNSPVSGTNSRLAVFGLAGLMAAHAVICWLSRPPGFVVGQDDVEYAVLGQSLRHAGYNLFFRVDNPVHAQYPPGYPAILGAWGAVFGDGFNALVLVSVLASAALIGVTWLGVRRVAGPWLALVVAAVLVVNPSLVKAGSSIASETPYALLSTLALLLLMSKDRRARLTGLAGALAIYAALTRSIGIVLVMSVGALFVIERRWKALAIFAVASALLVGGWMLWTVVAPERYLGMSYVADFRASTGNGQPSWRLLRRVWRTVEYYSGEGVPWALGLPTVARTLVDNVAGTILVYTGLLAGLLVFVKRWRPAAIYLLFYFALLGIWRFRTDRFVIPTVPLLVAGIFVGWNVMLRSAPIAARRIAIGVVAVVLLLGGALRTRGLVAEGLPCRPVGGWPPQTCLARTEQGFFDAMRYIRTELPDHAVLLTAKSGALWEYTGHKSVSYGKALAQDTAGFVPFLKSSGAGWILLADLEQSESRGLLLRLEHACEGLSLEASFAPRTYLFRVSEPGESDGEACAALREFRERLPRATSDESPR